ncbi:MAG: hypothetical protein JRH15_22570 [Deltaproteobacteria bacterium]|nr:hypothetical protein [Deltaproteobacteria bacterium]
MNTANLGFKTASAFFIVFAILTLGASSVHADMCQIIRIEHTKGGGSSRLEVFPSKITVPVGTCTVWVNWVAREEVQVSFRENAKQCMLASESPTGFSEMQLKAGESCYISESLPRGKTASLFWNKPGVYKYNLEISNPRSSGSGRNGKLLTQGVIEVQ